MSKNDHINVTTKHLSEYIQKLDFLHDSRLITVGEYINAGLQLKILEQLYRIERKMGVKLEN